MVTIARALTAAAVLLAITVPASAQSTPFVPDLREERTYLTCNGTNKVQNLNNPVRWNTTKPATSYTAGAGCGLADPGILINTQDGGPADLVMTGTYTGNLDKITVHLHSIDGVYTRSGIVPGTVDAQVEVDGRIVYETSNDGLGITPVRSSTGATGLFEFTITHLNRLAESDLREHDIVVRIGTHFSDDLNGWVWGASEIDSGVSFNPAKLSATRVRATG